MALFLNKFEHLKIKLDDIKSATGDFNEKNVIGKGGFGKVYRGEFSHSKGKSKGAFKRLDPRLWQGGAEFLKEIVMLSDYKHRNLISLLGYCDEGREKILVYEYASNGSLDLHLRSTNLSWRQRIKICLDAARGISFLHDDKGTMQRVIHRDIKSSNILLDDNWNAKVSDMGLSIIGPANQLHTSLFTNVVGTPGYCDPEYFKYYSLSKESDIYSFGVVLFEVLCGRLCYEYRDGNFESFVRTWKKAYEEKKLHEIVFQHPTQPIDPTSLETFSGIAFQCLQDSRENRPMIAHVVEKLEAALEFQFSSNYKDGFKEVMTNFSRVEEYTQVDWRRAINIEIVLMKVKLPFPDFMAATLAMDESILHGHQIENLIKFCPTNEEIKLFKNYASDKKMLGKCEQFFLELMKVPRMISKLRVFLFKAQFNTQLSELKMRLNTVNKASNEVRNSVKLKEIMKHILNLGNALNRGTARGSAVGFKLDSLLKLNETRASKSNMTLMHYLCKVLAANSPDLLDIHMDLASLESANEIQLKSLAEEMQAIMKGLEKVEQEVVASANDGPASEVFINKSKVFLDSADPEVRRLISLYYEVGRNADSLSLYIGEDPARYTFEQVTQILLNFVRLFRKAHEENSKQAELEKRELKPMLIWKRQEGITYKS